MILHSDNFTIFIFTIILSKFDRVKCIDNKYYLSWKSYVYTYRGGNKTVPGASKF
jgi:hypothetical protein